MACKGCGGGNGRGRMAPRPPGKIVVPRNKATVPASVARYVKYVGAIKYAVRGPRTGDLYGSVMPGDIIAVLPEDQTLMLTQAMFQDAGLNARDNAINAAAPACPKKSPRLRFAVRPQPAADGG